MRFLVLALLLLGAIYLLVRFFLASSPAALANGARWMITTGVGGLSMLLMFAGRPGLGALLAALALAAGRWARRSAPSPGHVSSVRSSMFEMVLDHDSGQMSGRVLAGEHAGRDLSELGERELIELYLAIPQEGEDAQLLEAYLDRQMPGWRENADADDDAGQGAPAGSGEMSLSEAYEVLGLEPGAGEADIRSAHRRLMKQVHPDRGGTKALAARINAAKDRLLKHV